MKNKKLFAILTLLCFLFTLMPVAAFAAETYAEVDSDDAIVRLESGKADVKVNFTNPASAGYWIYAVDADGKLYTGLEGGHDVINGFVWAGPVADATTVTFTDAGEYTVYATEDSTAITTVINNADGSRTKAQILALVLDEAVEMLDNAVTVKAESSNYTLTLSPESVGVKSNSGYTTKEVVATLTNTTSGDPVIGATLKISTNSSAVDVNKTEVKTNAAGQAKFKVSASTAGTFKVYVEYGTKADATLEVVADTLAPAKITTVNEPSRPIALDSAVGLSDVSFTIADANGNAIKGATKANGKTYAGPMWNPNEKKAAHNYKVAVTEKPVGSAIDADEIQIRYNADNAVWYLTGNASFDEEGDYSIKITLNNGNYATAKVTVKEFQTPVELKMVYKQNAVELNGDALLHKLYYVDANGTQKSLIKDGKVNTEIVLSANGYAIDAFTASTGTVTVKADEKYVGSKITVLAVSEKYNLTAAVELSVANEAAGVKYAKTEADVAVNNTLTANIVDMDGNKVALNANATSYDIQYIVLDKPVDSKVAISTLSQALAAKGEFKVSFTASEIGTYKVQTIVRYEQAGVENDE